MLRNIAMSNVYVNNERWSVVKMKTPYDIRFLALVLIIYQIKIIYYFQNRNTITIMKVDKGKQVYLVEIMFMHLVKELDRWIKS